MTDANSQFFAILTRVGMAKQANADALGIPWKLTEMGVGDANNIDPVIPSETQTKLINEWRRKPLNQLKIDPANPAVLIAEQVIPADEGGKWIREIGLYDADGDLVAVANCAPSFKPLLSQGSGRTQIVRMNFIVNSTGNITLKVDPAVVLATREFVEQRITEELYKLDNKQSVRVATTANIVLSGLQSIDGVALAVGDRVLVKNQTAAKDNGIWVVAASGWSRAADADSNAEVTSALLVSVEQGASWADTRWQLITDGAIVLGITALTFQNVTYGFAPLKSPAFLDNPTAPTPAQFDSSKSLPTTEFVQRALGNDADFVTLAGMTTLAAGHAGTLIYAGAGGNYTVTLPSATAVKAGSKLPIVMFASQPCVVATQLGQFIYFNGSQTLSNVTLGLGDSLTVESDGANWYAVGGSLQLKYAAAFGSNLASRGHQKLPSGLILQWGWGTSSVSGDVVVTFPIEFPTGLCSVAQSVGTTAGALCGATLNSQSKSGFATSVYSTANVRIQTSFYWIAIGF